MTKRNKIDLIPTIRVINYILLCLFCIPFISNMKEGINIQLSIIQWSIIFILPPVLSSIFISRIKNNHEFFEWDKKERKKKSQFLATVTFIVFFFCYLSVFIFVTSICDLIKEKGGINIFVYILKFSYSIILIFNAFYTVNLHYTLYDDYLYLDKYSIAEKPENWDWERTIHDDINDFMKGRL